MSHTSWLDPRVTWKALHSAPCSVEWGLLFQHHMTFALSERWVHSLTTPDHVLNCLRPSGWNDRMAFSHHESVSACWCPYIHSLLCLLSHRWAVCMWWLCITHVSVCKCHEGRSRRKRVEKHNWPNLSFTRHEQAIHEKFSDRKEEPILTTCNWEQFICSLVL